jgi:pimeloyl-ACP methyl ester carboxylesterase
MFLAALYPGRISKLGIIDAGGKIPADAAEAIAATASRVGVVYPSLNDYLATMRQLPVFAWNPMWEQLFRYDADVRPDGTVVSRVSKQAIIEHAGVLTMLRTEELPRFITCPTLIAHAVLGTLGPDRGFILTSEEAERLKGIIPNCQLIDILETNHYTIILSPILHDAIAQFLAA